MRQEPRDGAMGLGRGRDGKCESKIIAPCASWSLEASSNLPDCWGISRLRRWAFLRLWSCWWWETMLSMTSTYSRQGGVVGKAQTMMQESWGEFCLPLLLSWSSAPTFRFCLLYTLWVPTVCQALVMSTSHAWLSCSSKQSSGEMSLLFIIIAIPKGPKRKPTQMAKLRSKLGCIARESYAYPLLSAAF